MIGNCTYCKKEVIRRPYCFRITKNIFCSRKCYWAFLLGKPSLRKQFVNPCISCGKKLLVKRKTGKCFKCWQKTNIGENHQRWKGGECKKKNERSDPAYQNWCTQVKRRDQYTCRINNCDCSDKIVVHHILSWREYPELRYNINNGITLCQAHHPLKRAEEKRLVPFFMGLVPVSNKLI